jgi:hypothetical protein
LLAHDSGDAHNDRLAFGSRRLRQSWHEARDQLGRREMIDPHEAGGIRERGRLHCSKSHDTRSIDNGVEGLGAISKVRSKGLHACRVFEIQQERLCEAPREAGRRIVRTSRAKNGRTGVRECCGDEATENARGAHHQYCLVTEFHNKRLPCATHKRPGLNAPIGPGLMSTAGLIDSPDTEPHSLP